MDLKKYVGFRRAELKAERESLVGQNQGITTGSLMGFDQKARVVETMLAELDSFADWEANGEPKFIAPLAADEKAFWLKAMNRGVPVPDEIKAQIAAA